MKTMNEKKMMYCPLCGEEHLVEVKKRNAVGLIKEEKVSYEEVYFVCCEEDEEFITTKQMDANLLAARNAYRAAHNMMTSNDIVHLRSRYGLTQRELANALGWGEATITRYETKLIQDETHDEILHTIQDDAYEMMQHLKRNREKFEIARYEEIYKKVCAEVELTSNTFLTMKLLTAEYVKFEDNSDITGGKQLDIDKVCWMAAYYAQTCVDLFKVKLMKLLWYTDALFYKLHGSSMSGLVYQHMPMGALPVGHQMIMNIIPYEAYYESEYVSYKVLPKPSFSETVFTQDELEVLRIVSSKFSGFSGKDLANYMHQEIAYIETNDRDYIPFSLAGEITNLS